MAKWTLWAAHRLVRAGASVPRTVGPDGRLLRRPWRVRSEQVVEQAERIRAARPQAIWPKLLGWGCMGVACTAALMPLPPHVPVSAADRPVPELPRPAIAIPALDYDSQLGGFAWPGGRTAPPFTFVLLGADYRELARVDGIESTPWRPTEALGEQLRAGTTYHAYLLAGQEYDIVKSPLSTFVWRQP